MPLVYVSALLGHPVASDAEDRAVCTVRTDGVNGRNVDCIADYNGPTSGVAGQAVPDSLLTETSGGGSLANQHDGLVLSELPHPVRREFIVDTLWPRHYQQKIGLSGFERLFCTLQEMGRAGFEPAILAETDF